MPSKLKEDFVSFMKGMRYVIETPLLGIFLYGDSFRRTYTCGHEVAGPGCKPVHFENPNAEWLMYHVGDIPEGYGYTMAVNFILDYAFPTMDPSRRRATSFAIANSAIGMLEKDPMDLPAAVVGSAVYLCLDYYIDKSAKAAAEKGKEHMEEFSD